MIPLSEEVLLILLIVGLYVYDSTILLYCNEGVLIPGQKSWKVCFGFRQLRIAGKELFIPVPWLPHQPIFRLAWSFEDTGPRRAMHDWEADRRWPLGMKLPIWGMAAALFVMLPAGLFTKYGSTILMAAIACLYLGVLSLLMYMWLRRDELRLSKKQVLKFGFEYLTCPPFALNVIRTISSARMIETDLVTAAHLLQKPESWSATQRQLMLRLDEEIELAEEGTSRMAGLKAHRQKLAEQNMPCQ